MWHRLSRQFAGMTGLPSARTRFRAFADQSSWAYPHGKYLNASTDSHKTRHKSTPASVKSFVTRQKKNVTTGVWSHFPGAWSHPTVKVVTSVTWYQFKGFGPTRKKLEKSGFFLFVFSSAGVSLFPSRRFHFSMLTGWSINPFTSTRCERQPGVDVNRLLFSM